MPRFEFKLKNKKYCDGCLLMSSDALGGMLTDFWYRCSFYNKPLKEWKYKTKRADNKCIRPKKCIRENGE